MSEFVSQKQFLDFLQIVDYVKFGHIDLLSTNIIEDCESAVKNNPEYWYSNVTTDGKFDVWDSPGAELQKKMEKVTQGYLPENTRAWKTTSARPQINFSWEQQIREYLPLTDAISTPTLQTPGNVMPWHIDRFVMLKRQYPTATNAIRFLTFLKDWENGHILQAGNSIISHWTAGDVVVWHPERYHIAANIGNTNKWTCNITGMLADKINFKI